MIQVGNKDLNAIALEVEIVEEEKGWATVVKTKKQRKGEKGNNNTNSPKRIITASATTPHKRSLRKMKPKETQAGSKPMESSQKKDFIMDFVEEKPKRRLSLDSSKISKNQADKPIPRKIQRPKRTPFREGWPSL